MVVTEVNLTLPPGDQPDGRVLAYASIVVGGCLRVRDVKLISGPRGIFVQMPNRVRCVHCPGCRKKVEQIDRFCSRCGVALTPATPAEQAKNKTFRQDLVYPVHIDMRQDIEAEVMRAYRAAVLGRTVPERSKP